jgi:hypothetical protein
MATARPSLIRIEQSSCFDGNINGVWKRDMGGKRKQKTLSVLLQKLRNDRRCSAGNTETEAVFPLRHMNASTALIAD